MTNPKNIYTENNTLFARYELVRDGGVVAELREYTAGTVTADANAELKLTFRGTFFKPDVYVNYMRDWVRVILNLNGSEYNFGIFAIGTVSERRESGAEIIEIEGYSLLYYAKRARLENPLHIDAGANYVDTILEILGRAGLRDCIAENTAEVFSTEREDWESGTPLLDIVNQLLGEINYNTAWVDLDGVIHLTKFKKPDLDSVAHIYNAGDASIIKSNYSKENDMFDKCNVFMAVCSNPDLPEPLEAVAVNDDVNSPFSTLNMGARILHRERVNNIPNQEALQEYVNNLKVKSLQTTEKIQIQTAIVPGHGIYDTIAVENGDITGIYRETGWNATLDAGGEMVHMAERVIL